MASSAGNAALACVQVRIFVLVNLLLSGLESTLLAQWRIQRSKTKRTRVQFRYSIENRSEIAGGDYLVVCMLPAKWDEYSRVGILVFVDGREPLLAGKGGQLFRADVRSILKLFFKKCPRWE